MADEGHYEQFENHTRLGMRVRRRLVSEQSSFQKIDPFEAKRSAPPRPRSERR